MGAEYVRLFVMERQSLDLIPFFSYHSSERVHEHA